MDIILNILHIMAVITDKGIKRNIFCFIKSPRRIRKKAVKKRYLEPEHGAPTSSLI